MQHRHIEAESITHKYNSSTKPKFYKNTRLIGKIIEKTSLYRVFIGIEFLLLLLRKEIINLLLLEKGKNNLTRKRKIIKIPIELRKWF